MIIVLVFLITFSGLFAADYFYFKAFWDRLHILVKIIGIIISVTQLILYFYTSSADPGIPSFEDQLKTSRTKLKYCKKCNLWTKRFTEDGKQIKTDHCKDCNICIEGKLYMIII